jgi:hypothetical protein
MTVKTFYLVGEDFAHTHEIDVGLTLDLEAVKASIAAHYNVVEAKGA